MKRSLWGVVLLCAAPAFAGGPGSVQGTLRDFAAQSGGVSLLDEAPAPPPVSGRAVPGHFKLVYEPPKKTQGKKWERILKESKLFDEAVSRLNDSYVLPHDVTVEVKECGEANAWYHPDEAKVIICYEEIANTARLLAKKVKRKKNADALALGDAIHTLLHEVGHALIDLYKLPAVGREEDAVDQFATLTLLRAGENGELAAQVAAMTYLLSGKEKKGEKLEFWDEHSFDHQRYYDILCLIYGKDPDKHADFVPKKLPEARAERCEGEYQRLDAAWDALLAPHRNASSSPAVGK